MKKFALLLAVVLLVCSFGACGGSADTTTTEVTETEPEKVVISVNKEVVSDEVEFLSDISEIGGIESVKFDTHYQLTMSQETYKKLLSTKKAEVTDSFDAVVATGGYITGFEYDTHFRNIDVLVDREGYDADPDSAYSILWSIGAKAMSYQLFLPEGWKTSVSVVYSDTKDVVFTLQLPVEM